MIAPRAVFIIGNGALDYEWLAEQSAYVSSRAAEEVYKALGIPDRFGFSHSGHTHCAFPDNQAAESNAFVDKFLLGKSANTTGVSTNPFPNVDFDKWISAWKNQTISPDATGLEKAPALGGGIRILTGPIGSRVTLAADGPFAYEVLNRLGQRMEAGEAVDRVTLARIPPPGLYVCKIIRSGVTRWVRFIKT